MEDSKKKGSRIIGGIIILLVFIFFVIEIFIRESKEFSPTSFTNILLTTLQVIVFLLFLILFSVLGRNLIKLYLERKRKVIGAHFKTRLLIFFISLSFIPTLLLFLFASDLISRNVESWFRTPMDKILQDTQNLADGFYSNAEEITLHYARQLSKSIQKQRLLTQKSPIILHNFIRSKLVEYHLDEISLYQGEEELFSYLNPNLPYQYYRDLSINLVKRAHLGEEFSSILPMGQGQMIRRGVSFETPEIGKILVVTGKYIPQNYTEKINSISAFVQRYSQLKTQKNPFKTFYVITLLFVTLLIIFAATWIAFHLAKGITVPIEKLAQATREVSKGNLNIQVEDPASDELGILIDSFNQMIRDLRDSHDHIAQKTSELEARKKFIETVLDNVTTGVITLNEAGRITSINPSALKMLGLVPNNWIGHSIEDIFHETKSEQLRDTVLKGMKRNFKINNQEIQVESDGQNRIIALSLAPLPTLNDNRRGWILVLDDLTQLIKAQKLTAWKEVAQRVAHEIKNPLTPIQLSAERILKNIRSTSRRSKKIITEGAQTIVDEAATIKSLVDEFSTFARLPSIQLKETSLHQLITQTIALFKGIYDEVEFKTSLSPGVPRQMKLDPEQMKRVFINLIDNAIEAMDKRGEIHLSTDYDEKTDIVRIEIADSGPGVPDKDKDKLFLPHFSTKKKGTGLGLAIVHQIISEHKGTIEIEDNLPHGAKFIIQVPKQ
ncbi:MAG TPA: PAS domain S-box protein [Candidatus Aminicenantes bacterium]|nr:PAS domain S-box protein [Candidatus Aminicenantes bacterium]